jgi:hypothetical protein
LAAETETAAGRQPQAARHGARDAPAGTAAVAGTDQPAHRAAAGYELVIPPEWRKIPLREGTDQAVRQIIEDAFSRVPRGAPPDKVRPFRRDLERRLASLVADARQKAGLDLYLPVLPMHGAPIGASFVVSEIALGAVEPVDPPLLVAALAAEDDAVSAVTVDGACGIRAERTAGPLPSSEIESGSRRVDYLLAVPGSPDRWLAIAFSTLGGGDPDDRVAGILVMLFDAIMSTFQWTWGDPGKPR